MALKANELLQKMLQAGISDIHFKADAAPMLRIRGELVPFQLERLDPNAVEALALSLMNEEQKARFQLERELDFAFAVDGLSRFRVNAYRQKGTVALTLRVVPLRVQSFEELNLPSEVLAKLSGESRGLILIAGITGSGKTTTLNAMLDFINARFRRRIVTVEDPIEFYHADQKSSIVQREVGLDTHSFKSALHYALRQDPDVIVVGEMRDSEAVAAALTAAETGHLVLSTIHTMDAVHTLDRVVDAYPPHLQHAARGQFAAALKGIVAQRLVPAADSRQLWPACEILVGTSLVRKLIAEGKPQDIVKAMEQGEYYKMRTFDQDLLRLVREKKITLEQALEQASNSEDLALKARGIGS